MAIFFGTILYSCSMLIKWILVLLACLNFGYMAGDGAHALIKGDYIRPRSGRHAGELGPWSKLLEGIGLRPLSVGVKLGFLMWGLTGLVLVGLFVWQPAVYRNWLLVLNVCTLWYLWPGTFLSALQIALLFWI